MSTSARAAPTREGRFGGYGFFMVLGLRCAGRIPKPARGNPADGLAIDAVPLWDADRLLAHDDGAVVCKGHRAEFTRHAFGLLLDQGFLAYEITLVEFYCKTKPRFVGSVIRRDFAAPVTVGFFETE